MPPGLDDGEPKEGDMDETKTARLTDEDIRTVLPGTGVTLHAKDGDTDGTDTPGGDGTDGDATDGKDGDAKDSDGTDSQDTDGTDSRDADGTDSTS
jgi:hypothetical protein